MFMGDGLDMSAKKQKQALFFLDTALVLRASAYKFQVRLLYWLASLFRFPTSFEFLFPSCYDLRMAMLNRA